MNKFPSFHNLVSESPQAYSRLIRNYDGARKDFDFIIVGSGMGGGILADDLADKCGNNKRILVIDAGSFIYPTHVYNISRFSNEDVAHRFGVQNFRQTDDADHYIKPEPQMGFGGRSIFWSGLIPTPQSWESEYFPRPVRNDLERHYFSQAGRRMNESVSLGSFARSVVDLFNRSDLVNDFIIEETPRAVHQPYLYSSGKPRDEYFHEPTGVFNTAELLINQSDLNSDRVNYSGNGLFIRLNSFVERISDLDGGLHEVLITDTITGDQKAFKSGAVIIAAGSTESPKLVRRMDAYSRLPGEARAKVGVGLTDHPVSGEAQISANRLVRRSDDGEIVEEIPIRRNDHAKIILYSKGMSDRRGALKYPFNVELNINHEYWHLRNNDPSSGIPASKEDLRQNRVDIKFSFANNIDDENVISMNGDDDYMGDVKFSRWTKGHLIKDRFPNISGWDKDYNSFGNLLNEVKDRIFNCFDVDSYISDPFYNRNWTFGYGTVHHACGTLRMPWRSGHGGHEFSERDSVVDTDLRLRGSRGIFVCDMSVMPVSTAANPVRALCGLALRLSDHLLKDC
jgi:hypothetical protein